VNVLLFAAAQPFVAISTTDESDDDEETFFFFFFFLSVSLVTLLS